MVKLPACFASLAIIGCLAVGCIDIVTGLEHWPLGSYPMYSTLYPARLSWLRLYGVTDRGSSRCPGRPILRHSMKRAWSWRSNACKARTKENKSWMRRCGI